MRCFFRTTLLLGGLLIIVTGCKTTGTAATAETVYEGTSVSPDAVAVAEGALEEGRFREALDLFGRMLQRDPENARAKLGIAEVHRASGAFGQALAEFDRLTASPEVRLAAMQGKGICLLLTGKEEEALEVLAEVVSEDPSRWRAWNALGRIHDGRRQWTEAQEAYRKAAAAAPEAAVVHNNWGMSSMAQSRYEEAADKFSKSLALKPDLETARTNLRLALAFQGKYAESMSGVGDKEMARVLNDVGFVALLRGDSARAEAYFVRAIEASPRYYDAAWRNLRYLASLEDIETANNPGGKN